METFSALLAFCAGNSPVTGEFPTQRPVARSFDVFFDLRLHKRFSKQSWGWWFETLSWSLWRHRNAACACGYPGPIDAMLSVIKSCLSFFPSSLWWLRYTFVFSFELILVLSFLCSLKWSLDFHEHNFNYGGPEGTSPHILFDCIKKIDVCEKNIMWLCIHNYFACIHNYLACIHNYLTCIHN